MITVHRVKRRRFRLLDRIFVLTKNVKSVTLGRHLNINELFPAASSVRSTERHILCLSVKVMFH
jgi:hypothetical protein